MPILQRMSAKSTTVRFLSAALLAVYVLRPSVATAEGGLLEAKRHFSDGVKAFNLGEFARAAQEYRAAYLIKPDPVLLYNIAQSYRLAGDAEQALFFYRSFLNSVPKAVNRAEVHDRIAKLEAEIEEMSRQAKAQTPPPAPAAAAEPAAPAPVAPAPVAVAPAAPAPTVIVMVTDPKAKPEPSLARSLLNEPPKPAPTPVYKKWWLWTVVGVAVAGAAVGAGLGVGLRNSGPPPAHFGPNPVF